MSLSASNGARGGINFPERREYIPVGSGFGILPHTLWKIDPPTHASGERIRQLVGFGGGWKRRFDVGRHKRSVAGILISSAIGIVGPSGVCRGDDFPEREQQDAATGACRDVFTAFWKIVTAARAPRQPASHRSPCQ